MVMIRESVASGYTVTCYIQSSASPSSEELIALVFDVNATLQVMIKWFFLMV